MLPVPRQPRSRAGCPAPRCHRAVGLPPPAHWRACILSSCPVCCQTLLLYSKCHKLAVLVCIWLWFEGWESRSWTVSPRCRSCKPGRREMDGAAPCPCFCPSPSLLKAGHCIPGSASHVSWATGRSGCARRAGFPLLWGCLHTMKKNMLWKQKLFPSGDNAVPSTTKEPIPCRHWIRWAGAMSRVMKCSVLQTYL